MSTLSHFPNLATERLLLRRLNATDADDIFLLRSDAEVNKYLDRPKATSRQDAIDFINRVNFASDNQQSLFWAVCLRDTNELAGTICLWNFSAEKDKAEIGYELLPKFQKKGIMQEALSTVLEFGFRTLKLSIIEAWTVQQNMASIRMLERNHFIRNRQLEMNIDRSVEGPDLIIYSLFKYQFNSGAAPL